MLPWISVALCELFHVARSNAHVSSRVNLYLQGEKHDFPREVLHGTACVRLCRSEIILEK